MCRVCPVRKVLLLIANRTVLATSLTRIGASSSASDRARVSAAAMDSSSDRSTVSVPIPGSPA
jgi:hypothetical protein